MIKITQNPNARSLSTLWIQWRIPNDKAPSILRMAIAVMNTTYVIRRLVEKALYIRQLTPDIENEINYELTRLGYISDADYEALELLMAEMDAGRVRLVPNP